MNSLSHFNYLEKNANYILKNIKNIKKSSILSKNYEFLFLNCENLNSKLIVKFKNVKLNLNENHDEKKPTWTKEQEEAIISRDKNLLVSASAGSGKTTVMTQRIANLVYNDRIPITNFLIVTYTSASAQDMKLKIIKKLSSLPQDDFVLTQIDNVSISDISDMHSFYSRLISTYFYEVNVDPNFSIIDAIESELLRQRAVTKVFEDSEKENPETYYRLFDIVQKNRSEDGLKSIVFSLSNFLASIIDADAWFKEKLDSVYNEDIEKNISAIGLKNSLIDFVENSILDINEFLKLCPECETYNTYFQNVILTLSQFSRDKSVKETLQLLFNMERFPNFVQPKDEKFLIFHEQGKSILGTIKGELSSFKKYFVTNDFSILSKYILEAKKDVISLYELTKKFDETYAKIKKDMGVLDFNDLEKFAFKILSNEKIRETVKNKYKYIFVDEFQDINEIQEKIISLIASDNNRFMVGDVKQSIYGFRLCDPEIFLRKYKDFEVNTKNNELVKLNCNFRSDSKILKFVDDIFSVFMTERFGGINYERDSLFTAGEKNPKVDNSVNLLYIDITAEDSKLVKNQVYSVKNHKNETKSISKGKMEALLVAQKIAEILKEEKCDTEKIKMSDFAILYFTKSKTVAEFIDEFKKLGYQVSIDKNGDIVQKGYIQEILNFVKICINEKDDFLLFKVLKSKLFDFSDNEIVQLRLINQDVKFHELINEIKNIEDENLKIKFQNFYNTINLYKRFAKIMSIKDFCKKIVKDFKLEKLNLINSEGHKFNEDIYTFLSALPDESVVGFLTNYSDFSIEGSTSGGDDMINIMTVHKSKGMEFKYVFIINTSGEISTKSLKTSVLLDKNYMIGINYYDYESRVENQTIPMSMCEETIRKRLLEEQLRVFYVALTRAQKKLFVVCTKRRDELTQRPKGHRVYYSNWLEFLILHKLDGTMQEKYDYIKFEKYSTSDFDFEVNSEKFNLILKKQDNVHLDTFDYKFLDSTQIALKNSVSKILKSQASHEALEEDFDDGFEKQENDFNQEFLVSCANRGTAYHKFFQNVDFSKIDEIDLQFNSILDKFTDEEKGYIDISVCKKILANPFFKQISGMKVFKEREFFAEMPAKLVNKNALDGENIIMQGVIDFMAVSDKEIIVLDYKTGKKTQEKLEKYSFQLDMYSRVCERALSLPVTQKILCFIDEQEFVKI